MASYSSGKEIKMCKKLMWGMEKQLTLLTPCSNESVACYLNTFPDLPPANDTTYNTDSTIHYQSSSPSFSHLA